MKGFKVGEECWDCYTPMIAWGGDMVYCTFCREAYPTEAFFKKQKKSKFALKNKNEKSSPQIVSAQMLQTKH